MTTLRDHCRGAKREAHAILDAVRAGADIPDDEIVWALVVLGETVE